jgi:hypothetical protein
VKDLTEYALIKMQKSNWWIVLIKRETTTVKWYVLLNILITITLFILPYWLFDSKLFIGGDDSRLFYVYPTLWLKNVGWFSWFNFSSVGLHNPQQFTVPLITILAACDEFLPPIVISNLAFSAPILLGFIYFQKMMHALVYDGTQSDIIKLVSVLGGLFFIMSPIIWAITIAPFLYAVWLLALLPILLYYFLVYLRTGLIRHVVYSAVICVVLSLGLLSVPWFLGTIIPIAFSLLMCAVLFRRSEIALFLKRAVIYSSVHILAQSFWLLPFVMSIFDKSGSFAGAALSTATKDTFAPTVMATMSHNNLLFPLLNLFHRSIAFDFDWALKAAFEHIYDHILILNLIFVVIVLSALITHRKSSDSIEKKTFHILVVAWLISLFLFTVNIGPLKDLFISFGAIPGFAMFRNAFDKFAIGFVFIYATLISYSLWIVLKGHSIREGKYNSGLIVLFSIALVLSAVPIKSIVNRPLWTTNNKIGTVINIPDEYTKFIEDIKRHTQLTGNILSLPFSYPAYTIIKENESNAVFAGSSPLKILTGVNDFSGFFSFTPAEAQRFHKAVLEYNFAEVGKFIRDHNIGYIFITHNVPPEVMRSYLFVTYPDQVEFNKIIDTWLLPNYSGARLALSENGAYELYRTNVQTSVLQSKDLVFKKISPVKYKLRIPNITENQVLIFKDTFSFGWKLYMEDPIEAAWCKGASEILADGVRECGRINRLFDWDDIRYLWRHDLPFNHSPGINGISNIWDIDRHALHGSDLNKIGRHPDGTMDIEMSLYFYPQLYFYIGIMISLFSVLVFVLLAFKEGRVPGDGKRDVFSK